MGLKWYEQIGIVDAEAQLTKEKAQSTVDLLEQSLQARREREDAEAAERGELSFRRQMEYLQSQNQLRAADDIAAANKILTQLGASPTQLIDVSESNINRQILSDFTEAQSIAEWYKIATRQARMDAIRDEAEDYAKVAWRNKYDAGKVDRTWEKLFPNEKEAEITKWTQTLLQQYYPDEYGVVEQEVTHTPEQIAAQIAAAAQDYSKWTGQNVTAEQYEQMMTQQTSLVKVEVAGLFNAVFPGREPNEVVNFIETNPEGFIAELQKTGWTLESEAIVKLFNPEITTEELQGFFGQATPYIPENMFKDAWDALVVGAVSTFHYLNIGLKAIAPSFIESVIPEVSQFVTLPVTAPAGGTAYALSVIAGKPDKSLLNVAPDVAEEAIRTFVPDIQAKAEETFFRLVDEHNDWIEAHPELTPKPKYELDPWENPELFKDAGWWMYNISSSAVYSLTVMAVMVGLGTVAGPAGITAGMVIAGMPEAAQMVEELTNQGVEFEEAVRWAMLYGLAAGGIETVSDLPLLGILFKPFKPAIQPMLNTIRRLAANGIAKKVLTGLFLSQTEGLEELVTQAVHNAILQHYDETQSITEGISDAYIRGVIASLPFAGLGGYASHRTFRNSLSDAIGKQYDTLVAKFQEDGLSLEDAQVKAANEVARTIEGAEEIAKAIEVAQKEYNAEKATQPVIEKEVIPEAAEAPAAAFPVIEDESATLTQNDFNRMTHKELVVELQTQGRALLTDDVTTLRKLANYRKGYQPDINRGNLVFGAIKAGVITDGSLLVENREATEREVGAFLRREINKEARRIVKADPKVSIEEARQRAKAAFDRRTQEATFPDYRNLYPATLGSEVKLVGVYAGGTEGLTGGIETVAYLSDGKNIMAVDADKLAFVLQHLPDAKMHFASQRPTTSPLVFQVEGENKGLLRPLTMQEIPTAIQQAATKGMPEAQAIAPIAPAEITPELARLRSVPINQLSRDEIERVGVRNLVNKFSGLKKKIKNLPLEYRTRINSIVSGFDVKFRTNKTLARRAAMMDYIERLRADGIEPNIPEGLVNLANKTPLQDMTMEQLEKIYNDIVGLIALGNLKNKLIKIQANRQVKEMAGELTAQLGKIPKQPEVITKATLREARIDKSDIIESIINRTYRIDRLFLQMDGMKERGLFYRTFYKPINNARNQELKEVYTFLEERLRPFLKVQKVNIGKFLTKTEEIEGVKVTSSEKVGIYLHSLNEDNLLHLRYGNKFTEKQITAVINSLTAQEKALAEFMRTYFAEQGPIVSKIRTMVEGRGIELVDNYFPIVLEWAALPEISFEKMLAQDEAARFAARWASSKIKKSWLRQRSHKAMQPVQLDAITLFYKHINEVAHYKAFAPAVRDLQLLLHDTKFKNALIATQGRPRYEIIDTWLKQVADADPLRVTKQAEKVLRFLRVNAVAAVAGINITMSLRQFPSWFTGMAEIGEIPTLKGLYNALHNWKATRNLIRQYDPQTYRRAFEREIAEARQMKNLERKVMGKLAPIEAFTFLVRKADQVTVTAIWRGAFDEYLRKNPGDIEGAAEEAARVIRRTQPVFEIKDLAEYWRSGEFMKALTMWTNQLNQNWNYYRFDIIGKAAAGEISFLQVIRKVMEAFVIPALLIGWTIRSRPPENAEEFIKDMGTQGLGTVPIVGSYLASVIKGYSPDVDLMTLQVLERLQRVAYQINQQNWEGAAKTAPEIAGFIAGLPTVQVRRWIESGMELAEGKSDDWMRLIFGSYAREKYIGKSGKISTETMDAISQLLYAKKFEELTKNEQEIVLTLLE